MGQVWIFGLIFIFSINALAEEVRSNRRPARSASESEIQCRAFLERSQAGLVASLETQIQDATISRDCSNTTPFTDCAQLRNQFLQDLNLYGEYRNQVGRRDITYTLGRYDISDGGLGTDLRTPMREAMTGLGEEESNQIWNQFLEFQKNSIGLMFEESHAGQMLYPRELLGYADSAHSLCLHRDSEGEIQFDINLESHIATPKFITEFPREQRDIQFGCRQLQAQYTSDRDFQRALHTTISQAYRMEDRDHGDIETNWNAENGLAWLNYLSGGIENKTEAERLTLASEAFNRQISDLTTLKNRIEGLGPTEIDQLLAFDAIRDEIGGSELCADFGQTSFREAAEMVATFLPFINLPTIYFEGLRNDQNFIAGFNSLETYRENRAGISQAMAGAVVTDAFVGAVAGEALIMGGRVAARILSRRARARNLTPSDVVPIPPTTEVSLASIARASQEMDEVTSAAGVRFIPEEAEGETWAMTEMHSGETRFGQGVSTDNPIINRFYTPDTRNLRGVHQDELGLAFNHRDYHSLVEEAERFGYRVAVDPSVSVFDFGGYVRPDARILALRPDADMATLRHELQHVQFEHYIRSNYGTVRYEALRRGPDHLFFRMPAQARATYQFDPNVRNIWSREEWRIIQNGIVRGHPDNSIDEALSVQREISALGFRRIDFRLANEASRLGGTFQREVATAIHSRMYANSHLITDLRRLRRERGLNRRQTRELRAAERRHVELIDQFNASLVPAQGRPTLSNNRSRAALAALIAAGFTGVANANPIEIAEQAREVYFHTERNAMIIVLESGEQLILGRPRAD